MKSKSRFFHSVHFALSHSYPSPKILMKISWKPKFTFPYCGSLTEDVHQVWLQLIQYPLFIIGPSTTLIENLMLLCSIYLESSDSISQAGRFSLHGRHFYGLDVTNNWCANQHSEMSYLPPAMISQQSDPATSRSVRHVALQSVLIKRDKSSRFLFLPWCSYLSRLLCLTERKHWRKKSHRRRSLIRPPDCFPLCI